MPLENARSLAHSGTVDGWSFNVTLVMPQKTAFDRFEANYAMSLFDPTCKCADVIPTDEVADYMSARPVRKDPGDA